MRKFLKINKEEYNKYNGLFSYDDIVIPQRQTSKSCGYDFVSPHEVEINPGEVKVIYSGIKCALNDNEYLLLAVRSSIGIKRGIVLANQVGIIDADYFENPDNDGHIMIALRNITNNKVIIKKGERVVQGIIMNYQVTDDDVPKCDKRSGGIGSTGK